MILVVDNYDSFSYNLVQLLGELGSEVQVRRNDALDADGVAEMAPAGVVLSPGPSHPDRAGNSATIARRVLGLDAGVVVCPVLGVCLGHQVIARIFGAAVGRAPAPVHGKLARIEHDGAGIFANLALPLDAVRYHSLTVDESTLPPELRVTARSEDGVIMGLRHAWLPAEGVQFHPESILTSEGGAMLSNFLALVELHAGRRVRRCV
ncbi:MAG: aminodeoxychorismate/anthranilate synthase component II [Gemmatimonadota bacterium]